MLVRARVADLLSGVFAPLGALSLFSLGACPLLIHFSDEDYERTFGGKTIAAGLTIRVTPSDDLSSPPEVEVSQEVEAELVKDEVCVEQTSKPRLGPRGELLGSACMPACLPA